MAQIITIINFKGGVGKTTCSVEIAAALAKHHGRRTLLVDLDPQASATFYVMEQEHWQLWKNVKGSTYDIFERRDGSFPVRNAIVPDVVPTVFGFDLLPSNPDLVDVDLRLSDFVGHNILQRCLEEVRDSYDYIICDCPPNFNPVTKNSLWASDAYVVPTVPDFLSTYGIALLQRSINKLFPRTSKDTPFIGPVLGGIILTRVRTNIKHQEIYCQKVRDDYPGNVFKHVISDSVQIARAPDDHIPVSVISPATGQTLVLQQQFKDIAGEFISRIHHVRPQKKLAVRQSTY